MKRWWDSSLGEKYWLEITDRSDLGVDLKAPQSDDGGNEYWSYALVREVAPGDVVFHYWKPERAIVGWSRAIGEPWAEDIIWGSHGTVAREAGIQPYRRPGWRLGLSDFTRLDEPVTLDEIRAAEPYLRRVAAVLEDAFGGGTYFPIALSDKRPPRPTQGYLTKWPADLNLAFPSLARAAADAERTAPNGGAEDGPSPERVVDEGVGAEYRPADVDAATSEEEPFARDPAVVERGLRGHAQAQEALAQYVRELGAIPRSPRADEPNYDLAWEHEGQVFVAEVKSITDRNEEKQLRLGLGQVLRYRQLLSTPDRQAAAVLMVERAPRDPSWLELCDALDVRLRWPALVQAQSGTAEKRQLVTGHP